MDTANSPSPSISDSPASWEPPSGVTDHFGKPIPPGRDFFLPPPQQIGAIISAWSSVKAGKTLWPLWQKIALSPVITAVVVLAPLGLATAHILSRRVGVGAALLGGMMACPVSLALALWRSHVSYVGAEGVAFYSTRGTRRSAKAQVVRFADVADSNYSEQRYEKDGLLTVEFKFTFVDASGRTLLKLAANETQRRGRFSQNSVHAIAAASQNAWKRYQETHAGVLGKLTTGKGAGI